MALITAHLNAEVILVVTLTYRYLPDTDISLLEQYDTDISLLRRYDTHIRQFTETVLIHTGKFT